LRKSGGDNYSMKKSLSSSLYSNWKKLPLSGRPRERRGREEWQAKARRRSEKTPGSII